MLPDSLIEKAKSKELKPIGRAKVFKKLIDEFGLTTGEIAKRIGKSSSYVSNTLRLLTLPEALRDGLASGLIFSGHGRALAAIVDQRMMIVAYKQILRKEGSVREAEELARRLKKKTAGKSKEKREIVLEKMKRKISQALDGARVDLSHSRVQTRISISLRGNDGKTEDWLKKVYRRLTRPNSSKGQ